jgi:hypothetical protein
VYIPPAPQVEYWYAVKSMVAALTTYADAVVLDALRRPLDSADDERR